MFLFFKEKNFVSNHKLLDKNANLRGSRPYVTSWHCKKGGNHVVIIAFSTLVGVRGLEPPASRSQTAYSSQLSYTPTLLIILATQTYITLCQNNQKEQRKCNFSVKKVNLILKTNFETIPVDE